MHFALLLLPVSFVASVPLSARDYDFGDGAQIVGADSILSFDLQDAALSLPEAVTSVRFEDPSFPRTSWPVLDENIFAPDLPDSSFDKITYSMIPGLDNGATQCLTEQTRVCSSKFFGNTLAPSGSETGYTLSFAEEGAFRVKCR
jgi:hypothetical protein